MSKKNNSELSVRCKRKKHWDDRLFVIVNSIILIAIFVLFLYPVWFVLIASVSDPTAVSTGRVMLWPVGFELKGYERVFSNPDVWLGYGNTIFYTIVGTVLNVLATTMVGYTVSRKDLPGRQIIMTFFIITMYFGGGLIPSYLNAKGFGLTNTRAILLILGLVGPTNIIICRTYFANSIPWELQEAAFIDGASDSYVFWKVVLPLSRAILAVMTITYAVGHWNNYFTAMVYLKDKEKFPLQLFLREILLKSEVGSMLMDATDPNSVLSMMIESNIAEQLKYALIVVATVPILAVYPWLEKYFEKGFMIGGIKG